MADNKFGTGRVLQNMQNLKKELPVKLANQAQVFFTASFRHEGWQGEGTVQKWKEVNRRIPETYEYKYPKKTGLSRRSSPVLVRTGKLKRAVSNSVRVATFEKVELVVPLVYADVHNTGTDDVPQRKFMGDGRELRRRQRIMITKNIDTIWQA